MKTFLGLLKKAPKFVAVFVKYYALITVIGEAVQMIADKVKELEAEKELKTEK